jgi:hypothetical protein
MLYAPDPPQPTSLLAHDVEGVRDAAYMLGAAGIRGSLQRMYNLHMALTYECMHYADEGAPDIQSHYDMVKHCHQRELQHAVFYKLLYNGGVLPSVGNCARSWFNPGEHPAVGQYYNMQVHTVRKIGDRMWIFDLGC